MFIATRSDDWGSLEAVVAQQAQHLSTLMTRLQAAETELQSTQQELLAAKAEFHNDLAAADTRISAVQSQQGSTFIRWGRSMCTNNSLLVYAGVAGGSWFAHTGAATNRLCLTLTPQYDNAVKPQLYGILYGAEYHDIPGHTNEDVPCSVCRAPQSTTIMVPATLTCPTGWTPQYIGHLASGNHRDPASTEYVCLDGEPENRLGGHPDYDGNLYFYTVTQCGSLPCPPYITDRVATCVVCSK